MLSPYSPADWPLVGCIDCGFVFLERVPRYEALVEDLAWQKSFALEEQRRSRTWIGAIDRLSRIRTRIGRAIDDGVMARALGPGGRALEIGCGWRTRLPDSFVPHGIEISAEMAAAADKAARARGGWVMHAPAVEGLARMPPNYFDAMLMRSYLEHEAQPGAVLKEAHRVLRVGGRIYVRVPNYNSVNRYIMGSRWCGFRFPDHVNYFTPQSLRRLAERHGFIYRRLNWASLLDDNLICLLVSRDG